MKTLVVFILMLLAIAAGGAFFFRLALRQEQRLIRWLDSSKDMYGWRTAKRFSRSDLGQMCRVPLIGLGRASDFSPCVYAEFADSQCFLLGFRSFVLSPNNLSGKFLFAFHASELKCDALYLTRRHSQPFISPVSHRVEVGASPEFFRDWVVYAESPSDSDRILPAIEELLMANKKIDQVGVSNSWFVMSGVRASDFDSLVEFWACGCELRDRLIRN